MVSLCPPRLQETVTGQDPGVVRLPTIQLQVTAPAPDAVFGLRPRAVEGPDLYSTSMEQSALGAVWALAVATLPCPVGSRPMIVTVSGGAGRAVGLGVRGRGAGGRVRVGLLGATVTRGIGAVGLAVVAGGDGVGVVEAADDLGGAASGGGVLAGDDSDPMTEAASALPAPRVTSPASTAPAAAQLESRKVGTDPRRSPTSPMPVIVKPAASSSQGDSPISTATRRTLTQAERPENQRRGPGQNVLAAADHVGPGCAVRTDAGS